MSSSIFKPFPPVGLQPALKTVTHFFHMLVVFVIFNPVESKLETMPYAQSRKFKIYYEIGGGRASPRQTMLVVGGTTVDRSADG